MTVTRDWTVRLGLALVVIVSGTLSAGAQQRPLLTEDPETIGTGRLLVEGGIELNWHQPYPASGLTGDLFRVPLGVSFGLGSIAELQFDGGFNRLAIDSRAEAPFSDVVTATGDTTSSVEDLVVATKIKLFGETEGRPALGVRFATKLPNASNENGLGLDTTDFHASVLIGKTVQSIRVVGNFGLGILGDPTRGDNQNDVLLYGLSVARALTDAFEFVAEVNGRVHTADGDPPPGTETRGALRLGTRYTLGAGRLDAAVLVGMTSRDPNVGLLVGYTHVFNAFRTP